MSKPRDPLFERHNEWVQHMYNPGYWVNRISPVQIAIWRWTRKHNRLVGGFNALVIGAVMIALFPGIPQALEKLDTLEVIVGLAPIVLITFVWVVNVILFLMPPVRNEAEGQQTRNKLRKKRLPKRRKDYR